MDQATDKLTTVLLEAMRAHIPTKKLTDKKSTHPWLTDEVLKLVRAKRDAAGSSTEEEAAKRCSEALLEAYQSWVGRTREELATLRRGSKK